MEFAHRPGGERRDVHRDFARRASSLFDTEFLPRGLVAWQPCRPAADGDASHRTGCTFNVLEISQSHAGMSLNSREYGLMEPSADAALQCRTKPLMEIARRDHEQATAGHLSDSKNRAEGSAPL